LYTSVLNCLNFFQIVYNLNRMLFWREVMKKLILTMTLMAMIGLTTACTSTEKTVGGTVGGAVAGGVIGNAIGGTTGAIIGTVGGGAIGYGVGKSM
jgi:hypothetical protein